MADRGTPSSLKSSAVSRVILCVDLIVAERRAYCPSPRRLNQDAMSIPASPDLGSLLVKPIFRQNPTGCERKRLALPQPEISSAWLTLQSIGKRDLRPQFVPIGTDGLRPGQSRTGSIRSVVRSLKRLGINGEKSAPA